MDRRLFLGAMAATATPLARASGKSAYPSRPIRWLVSYPAGGGADWFTRVLTEKVSAHLKQPIIIENRPGAAGTISLANLAQSAPDGYSVITGDMGTITISPLLLKSLPYDPVKAFTPVSLTARGPVIWVVNQEKVGVKTFQEFVALAKSKPGQISYGSFGEGSFTHVMTELLCEQAGIKLLHVPYKGAAPAQQDLLGGQIDAMFVPHAIWAAIEPTGRARALAVSSRSRAPQLPSIPSIAEQGVPDYDISPWQGVLVPAGTPTVIVDQLRAAIDVALVDPDVVSKLTDAGYVLKSSSTAEFEREIRDSMSTWEQVLARANIAKQ